MKNMTKRDLDRLMAVEAETCISLYMPADASAATTDQQRIRLKNLLRRAEKTALEQTPGSGELPEMIAAGRRLLENETFLRRQSDGLAVFIAPGSLLHYRLPLRFEESVTVSCRFAVKPLIPLFMAEGRFFILALSQARIRLFACTLFSRVEIDLVDVPDGIDEALQYDSKHHQLQFHTGAAGGAGRRPAMFHGHGVGVDDGKIEIRRYFEEVDRGLSAILTEPEVPLVLAGVDYLLPIFREVTSHKRVMAEGVGGNPDLLAPEELFEKALPIVRPEMEKAQRAAEAGYRERAGRGGTAAGVREVVPAAAFGRVETLFVALGAKRPGTFERDVNEVVLAEGGDPASEDLLELAVVETLRNGGSVYAVRGDRMPARDVAAAAILRY